MKKIPSKVRSSLKENVKNIKENKQLLDENWRDSSREFAESVQDVKNLVVMQARHAKASVAHQRKKQRPPASANGFIPPKKLDKQKDSNQKSPRDSAAMKMKDSSHSRRMNDSSHSSRRMNDSSHSSKRMNDNSRSQRYSIDIDAEADRMKSHEYTGFEKAFYRRRQQRPRHIGTVPPDLESGDCDGLFLRPEDDNALFGFMRRK